MERDLRIHRWHAEREKCSTCGFRYFECSNPATAFYPHRRVDYAEMERLAAEAAYQALHEDAPYHDGTFTRWAKKRSARFPYQATEGVSVGVALTDLTPWDQFTTQQTASPVPPTDKQQSEVSRGDEA